MLPRLSDQLRSARRLSIVGRETEKQLFRTTLAAPEPPFYLLYIFGPGGVGKSTLLRELSATAAELQVPQVYIDSRNLEPTPISFTHALANGLALAAPDAIEDRFASGERFVLLLDTFEQLLPLERWLRDFLLPQLPARSLIVVAGRHPLSPEWRSDPGWRNLLHQLSLRNLSAEESQLYLTRRKVPEAEQANILSFTHGHPLALSLVADVFNQRPMIHFQPTDVPDVLKVLLEQLVQKVPGPAHRAALEACALVRAMTEGLLSAMLAIPDAHELFDWLRSLSLIESGVQGIFPHDLARDILMADLRWRNPDWYAELHNRARAYYASRLQQVAEHEQQALLYDFVFLHRDNPMVRPFYEWQGSAATLPDRMHKDEFESILAIVQQHEGDESAAQMRFWIERQPESMLVIRGSEQEPLGIALFLALQRINDTDASHDPAIRAAIAFLQRKTPLRVGEIATYFRFWMARDSYQSISPVQSQLFINIVRHYLTTPGLAYTFIPCADSEFWAPLFAYADLARLPELDFVSDGHAYGVYGHDWRIVPPAAWLALMGEREMGTAPIAPPAAVERLIVLEASDFAAAVQQALKEFTRPLSLRQNPLLRSRLVVDQVGLQADETERINALKRAIRAAADSLQASSRDIKLYRALYHTYLQPAATQELAAEVLDLPFSTYRRHLKASIERLTELLWQQELAL
ncbi:MAG: ATP-binding protein [Caldilineaceae bacterium]|nr:ATP-binding protein [Caldilineaceae bacterium]